MSSVPVDGGFSRWERVAPILPYLFLGLPTIFALLRDWRSEVLGFAALAMAWAALMFRPGRAWGGGVPAAPRWWLVAHFAGTLVLLAALVRNDSLFSVTGVGVFVQAFTLLPGWWPYCGVAATAGVLVAARPESGRSTSELLFSFFVAALIASTTGAIFQTIAEQNERRRVMIGQLRETSARLAALAEENAKLQARLLTSAREAGVLGERQRLAREIHDTIAQGLTGIVTQVEAAEEQLDDLPSARSRLETVRSLAKDSLNEARRSIHALRPAPLDDSQLATALDDVTARWSQGSGVPASLSITGDARALHSEVEVSVLRIAQEALANIARHADASRVGLTLSYMEDVVALDIRDDGRGFTLTPTQTQEAGGDEVQAGGFGLVGMRQRASRLAGSFEIETAPGQGTGISATLPAIPPGPGG